MFYLVIAFASGKILLDHRQDSLHAYRVESNRIQHKITSIEEIEKLDMRDYIYVKKVLFLDIHNTNETLITNFFAEENNHANLVQPWYQNSTLKGYLSFRYRIPATNLLLPFFLVEGTLLCLVLFILFVLFYLKKNLIRPFHRLSNLPEKLAKGRFKGEVIVDKSKYFTRFLWGMSQLKDTLDISKKNQLEMIKEKKKIILSLSHDIKTPLNLIKLYAKALEENLYTDHSERKQALYQIGEKTVEIEQYIETITRSSTEDLIDLPVENGEFYISELIEKVLLVYQEQCMLQNIELVVAKYKNRLLKGDVNRSQEVLENIFENAIKYGDGKRIEISFWEEEYCQLIGIFNTGVKVTDNELNHLFDSFFRGSNAKGKQGSGLGLSICRELMRKMDGAIYVEQKEEGTMVALVWR